MESLFTFPDQRTQGTYPNRKEVKNRCDVQQNAPSKYHLYDETFSTTSPSKQVGTAPFQNRKEVNNTATCNKT